MTSTVRPGHLTRANPTTKRTDYHGHIQLDYTGSVQNIMGVLYY